MRLRLFGVISVLIVSGVSYMGVGLLGRKQVEFVESSSESFRKLEPTPENFQRLRELLIAINTGIVNDEVVRPSMQVKAIINTLGVSPASYYRWINSDKRKRVMPLGLALRSLAIDLLKVEPEKLVEYFEGNISLKDLLAIQLEKSDSTEQVSPDVVIEHIQLLDHSGQYVVLAWMLNHAAQELGKNPQKKNKTVRDRVVSSIGTLDNTNDMASNLGEGLSPQAATRLRNLLLASRAKHSNLADKQLDFDDIAEDAGIRPGTYNISAVEAAARGEISERYGFRLFPPEWDAIAVICFVPTGWSADRPVGLTDATYRRQAQNLKRTLTENGEPRLV